MRVIWIEVHKYCLRGNDEFVIALLLNSVIQRRRVLPRLHCAHTVWRLPLRRPLCATTHGAAPADMPPLQRGCSSQICNSAGKDGGRRHRCVLCR